MTNTFMKSWQRRTPGLRDKRIRHHLGNFDAVQPDLTWLRCSMLRLCRQLPAPPGTTTVSSPSRNVRPTSAIPRTVSTICPIKERRWPAGLCSRAAHSVPRRHAPSGQT